MDPSKPAASRWPLLALVGMEWRIGRRTPSFRFVALLAFLYGCTVGGTPGRGVGLSAYETAEAAWQILGFLAIVWVSLAAVRETTLRTSILIFSKPQPGERLALAKFLGAYLQLLAFLLALFAGSMCSRLFTAGGLLGAEAYAFQYGRAAGVLFFAASASYSLALLFDNAIAGTMVGLYWLLTLSGKAFLSKFYFPAYLQNLGAFVVLGLALLCITLLLYRRARRGDVKPALWIRAGAPACLLLSGWLFWVTIRDGYDPHALLNSAMESMGAQDSDMGMRAAGFRLPDQTGKLVGLSDYTGKILVIAIWSPKDPDSVLLLDRLNDAQARFGPQGVQTVAITICEDDSAAFTFAQGEHLQFPVVMDWGTTSVPEKDDSSPLASAYRASSQPKLIITDRRRRVRATWSGTSTYDGIELENFIKGRLAEEPQ